jgi:hypothetical protein
LRIGKVNVRRNEALQSVDTEIETARLIKKKRNWMTSWSWSWSLGGQFGCLYVLLVLVSLLHAFENEIVHCIA